MHSQHGLSLFISNINQDNGLQTWLKATVGSIFSYNVIFVKLTKQNTSNQKEKIKQANKNPDETLIYFWNKYFIKSHFQSHKIVFGCLITIMLNTVELFAYLKLSTHHSQQQLEQLIQHLTLSLLLLWEEALSLIFTVFYSNWLGLLLPVLLIFWFSPILGHFSYKDFGGPQVKSSTDKWALIKLTWLPSSSPNFPLEATIWNLMKAAPGEIGWQQGWQKKVEGFSHAAFNTFD